jgi:hypothetical protein
MNTIEQWNESEWEVMRNRLQVLSLAQLRDLATRLGIRFAGGNDQVRSREEFILVLDEAERGELEREVAAMEYSAQHVG